MSKNDKKGELSLPVIKIHHKAIVINAVVIESGVNKYNNGTEWKAYLYGNLTYDRNNVTVHCGKNILFNKWCCDYVLFIWEKTMKTLPHIMQIKIIPCESIPILENTNLKIFRAWKIFPHH